MAVYDDRTVITSGNTVTLAWGRTCTALPTVFDGGVFLVENGALLTGSSDTFFSNSAKNGGAVCNKGNFCLTGAVFGDNSASADGGAVWNNAATGFQNNAEFFENEASRGGAVFNGVSGTMDFSGSEAFSMNNASTAGGAFWNGGAAVFNGTAIFNNNSAVTGGALHNASGGIVYFKSDNTFYRNNATGQGGAVFNEGKVYLTCAGFTMNYSNAQGGAFYNTGTVEFQSDDFFTKNKASGNGGAVWNSGTASFCGTTFSANTSTNGNGGAVYNDYDGVLTFSGNNAFSSGKALLGGAVYNAGRLNLTGSISLISASDTIYNTGILNFDLGGGSTAYGSISNYQFVSNAAGSQLITVSAEQAAGDYVIASGIGSSLSGKETFSVTGITGLNDVSVTVGGGKADYGNYSCSLTQLNDTLIFSIEAKEEKFFYCSSWTAGQAVSVTWHDTVYNGTVGDGSFFNNYTQAGTAAAGAGQAVVVMESGTISSPTHYDACDAVLAGSNAVYKRMVLGGNLISGSHDYEGSYTFSIESGTFDSEVAGGDAGNSYVDRTGSITFNISGGTFNGNVLGGGYYAGSILGGYTLEGDVNFTISGGSFAQRVYGGCGAITESTSSMASMEGNVYLTIDASSNVINFGEHVAAGNRGKGLLLGSTNVTVTGLGSNLNFADNSVLFGGCGGDCYKTTGGVRKEATSVIDPVSAGPGKRALSFDDFNGDFKAEISMFSDISFVNGSIVNFADTKLNLSDVSNWNFDCTSLGGNLNRNDFTGDVLNVDVTGLSGSWTLLAGNSAAFDDLAEASCVYFNGNAAVCTGGVWSDGNYSLAVIENSGSSALVVSKLS